MPVLLIVAGIVLFAAACSSAPPCIDGSCVPASEEMIARVRAAAEVVHAFYGTKMPLPEIVVFEKGDCDAVFPQNGVTVVVPGGKIMLRNVCAFGFYERDNTIYMTTTADWRLTIAHELLHQKLTEEFGDGDVSHSRPEWKTWVPEAMQLI